jgi:hypothetical protein
VLKKVTAYSGSYQFVLDMSASESDGALIFDITGIAEDSREVTVDKLPNRTVISSIAPKQRIIVLTIRITDVDVETKRKSLTSVFAPGNNVLLAFETDNVLLRSISGVVESCNTPVFTKESTMTVTIICPDSAFTAASVMSTIDSASEPFTNPGDIASGCGISSIIPGPIASGTITVTNASNATAMSLDITKIIAITGALQANDIIVIETGIKKRCTLARGATVYNIFSAVSIPYNWIRIDPGANDVTITGLDSAESVLSYLPGYGGL